MDKLLAKSLCEVITRLEDDRCHGMARSVKKALEHINILELEISHERFLHRFFKQNEYTGFNNV